MQLLQTTRPNKQGNKLSFRATSSHLYQRYVFFARRTLSQISPAAPGLLLETVRVSLFKQLHDTCRQCSRKIYAITCHRIAVSYPMSSKCIKPKSSLSGESKATKPPTSKKEQSSSRPRSKIINGTNLARAQCGFRVPRSSGERLQHKAGPPRSWLIHEVVESIGGPYRASTNVAVRKTYEWSYPH